MRRLGLAWLLLACALADVAIGAPPAPAVVYPPELRGAWFTDDAEGRAGCAAHRRRPTPRNEHDWGRIVGAIMIGGDVAHHVSDYGEGAFYIPTSVVPLGAGWWRIESRVGIDGEPDPQEPPTVSELRLEQGRLQWRDAGESGHARPRLVLCSRRIPGDAG
ncbi:hypothetical protein [Lysobacter sp. N42]|uniref:hypothetical protein n=1 Tax=Lysobacter sp. N42 TaxID=2545719 RepID=UPI00104D845D|nr:hypothetical protein [Lysobacter sp. N42]TCZ86024.1 hypothetical protein EYQ95_18625 [Lysobacter sp. N42]